MITCREKKGRGEEGPTTQKISMCRQELGRGLCWERGWREGRVGLRPDEARGRGFPYQPQKLSLHVAIFGNLACDRTAYYTPIRHAPFDYNSDRPKSRPIFADLLIRAIFLCRANIFSVLDFNDLVESNVISVKWHE